MQRIVRAWLIAALVAVAGPAYPQTDVGSGFTSTGVSGEVTADKLIANDANPGAANRVFILENSGGAPALPSQCTATESGVAGKDCCYLGDRSTSDGTEDWAFICNTTVYSLESMDRKPLRAAALGVIDGGDTVYLPLDGRDADTSPARVQHQFPQTTRTVQIDCAVDVAPGAGETVTLTLQKGTCGALSATGLACEIADTDTSGNGVATITIAADECAAVHANYSGGAASSTPSFEITAY